MDNRIKRYMKFLELFLTKILQCGKITRFELNWSYFRIHAVKVLGNLKHLVDNILEYFG
jgi:hypothetical protein